MGTGCSACTKFTRDEDHWERVDGSIFILSALSKVFTGNKEIVKLLGMLHFILFRLKWVSWGASDHMQNSAFGILKIFCLYYKIKLYFHRRIN